MPDIIEAFAGEQRTVLRISVFTMARHSQAGILLKAFAATFRDPDKYVIGKTTEVLQGINTLDV